MTNSRARRCVVVKSEIKKKKKKKPDPVEGAVYARPCLNSPSSHSSEDMLASVFTWDDVAIVNVVGFQDSSEVLVENDSYTSQAPCPMDR
jgi:hypothetical protein